MMPGISENSAECPFSLPLGREQFAAALHTGHGRALMHVLEHRADGVEDLIVDACLNDKTFDPQCEGDRAPWMLEMVDAGGLETPVSEKVVAVLSTAAREQTFHDVNHLCRLALAFAKRGREMARSALYTAFRKNCDSADLIAGEEIIELDGADGLLFVAQRIGDLLSDKPDLEVGDDPLLWYDERHQRGTAQRLLESAAARNDLIAAYLAYVRPKRDFEGDSRPDEPKTGYLKPDILRFGLRGQSYMERIRAMTAEDVIRDIGAGAPGMGKYAYSGWGRRASDDDLSKIVEHLFRQSDPDRLARFLGVFQQRALPEFDARLLEFARHPDRDVRWVTMFVLAQHHHPNVRALALERVRVGRHTERELKLFRNNYQPGDWATIRGGLRWPDNEDELHWMLSDLLDVFEANGSDELLEPLTLIYNRMPCTNCRTRSVRTLLANRLAPAWLLAECRFDADAALRKVVS